MNLRLDLLHASNRHPDNISESVGMFVEGGGVEGQWSFQATSTKPTDKRENQNNKISTTTIMMKTTMKIRRNDRFLQFPQHSCS